MLLPSHYAFTSILQYYHSGRNNQGLDTDMAFETARDGREQHQEEGLVRYTYK